MGSRTTPYYRRDRQTTARIVSGGGGGKGVGQGEPVRVKHAPNSEPDKSAKCARTGTPGGKVGSIWRHYLRQEPGAVVPHAGICPEGVGNPHPYRDSKI